jgi:hypothetical protein
MDTAHNEFASGTDYTDSITVATADGTTQLITVTITGSNDGPTVANTIPDQPTGWTQGVPGSSFIFDIGTFNDVDTGDVLTYTAVLEGGAALSTIGLSFDGATRAFSGTPTATPGDYNIVVTATDTGMLNVSDTFALTVAAPAAALTLQAGNLDGLINLDSRSQIVLEFSEDILLANGTISIKDDMGTNGWTMTNPELMRSKQDVTDNDVVITISGGFVTSLMVGTVDRSADMAGSVTRVGNKLIISPAGDDNTLGTDWDFDWDFGANYHVELSAGVVTNLAGTLQNTAVTDSTTVNFRTVTPLGDSAGAQSMKILADGTLADSYIWHHGARSESLLGGYAMDFSGAAHALLIETGGGILRDTGVNGVGGRILMTNFTSDDLIYNDNFGDMNMQTTDGLYAATWTGTPGTNNLIRGQGSAGGYAQEIKFEDSPWPFATWPGGAFYSTQDGRFEDVNMHNANVVVFG